MVWRREVPLEMVRAALHWLPIVEAEQNFRWANIVTVGGGHFKNRMAMHRAIRPWQNAIRRGEPVKKEKPTREGVVAGFAMLGVKVVEVK